MPIMHLIMIWIAAMLVFSIEFSFQFGWGVIKDEIPSVSAVYVPPRSCHQNDLHILSQYLSVQRAMYETPSQDLRRDEEDSK